MASAGPPLPARGSGTYPEVPSMREGRSQRSTARCEPVRHSSEQDGRGDSTGEPGDCSLAGHHPCEAVSPLKPVTRPGGLVLEPDFADTRLPKDKCLGAKLDVVGEVGARAFSRVNECSISKPQAGGCLRYESF